MGWPVPRRTQAIEERLDDLETLCTRADAATKELELRLTQKIEELETRLQSVELKAKASSELLGDAREIVWRAANAEGTVAQALRDQAEWIRLLADKLGVEIQPGSKWTLEEKS